MRTQSWKKGVSLTLCSLQLALSVLSAPVLAAETAEGSETPETAIVYSTDLTDNSPANAPQLLGADEDGSEGGNAAPAERETETVTEEITEQSEGEDTAAVAAELDESVLFYADFEDVAEGALPEGMRRIQGGNSAVVENEDGNKVLQIGTTSNTNRVLIEMPDDAGNYVIEADVTFLSVAESTRWASIMYRIQNNSYPYFQMAVRQNATASNGVEMAKRSEGDAWDVRDTASYATAMELGTTYQWRVEVYGTRVKEYINGELIIFSSNIDSSYLTGDVGLQTASAVVQYDNLIVTALDEDFDEPEPVDSSYAAPKVLSANLVNAPTVIATAADGLTGVQELIADEVTSTLFLRLELEGGTLAAYSDSGRIGTLSEVLDTAYGKMLTIFRIEDAATADAFADFVAVYGYEDLHFASTDSALTRRVRQRAITTRASLIVEADSISSADAYAIVHQVNEGLGKNIIVHASAIDKEAVEQIQQLLITVFVIAEDDTVSLHEAITSGANGILTGDPQALLDAVSLYDGSTLTHRPFIIGHRGTPGNAPENTMASYRMSHSEFGSNMIETDVYLSRDGHVVVMHDNTLARTTDILTTDKITDEEIAATGKTRSTMTPNDLTLEQLKRLDAGSFYGEQFAGEPIPSLAELLAYVQSTDVVLFLEIKGYEDGLEQALVDDILSFGEEMMNQVGIITFNANQIKKINEIYPELSCGYLTSYSINTGDYGQTVERILQNVMPLNATYNPSYGYMNEELMRYMNARGISVWPWTYRSDSDHRNHIDIGVSGLTTDYANWTQDSVLAVYADRTRSVGVGQSLTLTADTITNNGQDAGLPSEIIVLENDGAISVSGNQITGLAEGTAVVMLKVNTPAQTGNNAYDLYTQPITIAVEQGGGDVEVESVKINTSALSSMRKNATVDLSVTITPVEASNTPITWTSSNANVLTVDENGRVTAHRVGSAIITATSPNGQRSMVTIRVSA